MFRVVLLGLASLRPIPGSDHPRLSQLHLGLARRLPLPPPSPSPILQEQRRVKALPQGSASPLRRWEASAAHPLLGEVLVGLVVERV